MILSGAAQMLNAQVASPLPDWLPTGATAFLDFMAGTYYAGGAPRSIGSILTGYEAGVISGSGMFFVFENGNHPAASGALLSDFQAGLAAGMTIILDFDFVAAPFGFALFLGDDVSWDASTDMIVVAVDDNMYDSVSLGLGASLSTTGRHTLAVTLNRDVGGGDFEYAWSLDGASALTQTVGYAAFSSLASVLIGHDGGDFGENLDSVYLRSITVYPAKDPAELPSLSDLPTT